MLLELQDAQLVLVDYQAKLMPVIHESEAVLANGLRLAQMAQLLRVPTWGTEQNPERLGPNPQTLRSLCRETLPKMAFSACAEGLVECLRPVAKAPQGNAHETAQVRLPPIPGHQRRGDVIHAHIVRQTDQK